MASLLNANLVQDKSEDMRSIMDNLTFSMEEMSRNLRIGYNYRCIDDGNLTATTPKSCDLGNGISFESPFGGQWVYYIDSFGRLNKSVDGGSTFTTLTSPEIEIDPFSGFSVLGAEPPPDVSQPIVRIKLRGEIDTKGTVTPFSLEAAVSQRTVDILVP